MKNENLKLIITGLLILLCASGLIYELNKLIPIRYHLNSEIWGTVSDWMTIIITLITAVFLYKTLHSQQEVQKMQQKLTDIEDKKYRYSLLPTLKLSELDKTPISIPYSDLTTGTTVINDEFDLRIDFEHQFIINARLLDEKHHVLHNDAIHLKNGTIYIELKHSYFFDRPIKRINDIDGKGMVSYRELILEIEDRDCVKSYIYVQIRLGLERFGDNQTQGWINKLSVLKYEYSIAVNN